MRRPVSILTTTVQLYLTAFLGLVPLPAKVQSDVIPVVRPLVQSLPQDSQALTSIAASLLGPRLIRRLPLGQTRIRRLHFQGPTRSTRGASRTDQTGQGGFEQEGCYSGLGAARGGGLEM